MAEKELSEETKRLLKHIVDHFDDEDRGVRDRQIRTWRRLKLLWENIQHAYYSEVAHDWRIPEFQRTEDNDQGYYDKPVNVYRAYLESIIAALSVTVPPVVCYPDDADNPLDVITAKGGDKIASLVFKHNDMPLFWLHALFVFVTEGMTACYHYPHESGDYGTYDKKDYEETVETREISTCPQCGTELKSEVIDPENPAPEVDPLLAEEFQSDMVEECETCNQMVVPQKTQSEFTVTKLVGVSKEPKSRICMEVYGGLNVKVPAWARNQKECSYLIYSYETHYANVREKYPDLYDKVQRGSSTYDLYEQWGRTSPQYRGEHPVNNVTVRECWFRPCAFNILNKDECEDLKEEFPNGVRVCVINDEVADARTENVDDFWTLTYNPLSDYIHFDPIGLLLVSVQDITNDLISLVLQTIEHGIPQTFADPKVLNFNSYRNSEVIPGGIYPATPKSGKSLSDGFYDVKTATLSQEVLPFAQKVQEIGQMVSGALPSLFGGQMSGSRTASEYSMSRAQALQRLQTTWKMLLLWWKNIFGKVIPMYIKEMKDDERQVQKNELGNFVNVFVRRSELEGKIGSIELEANENLPITWNQQKDAIMELFKMNNEAIMGLLTNPENIPLMKNAIGLDDFVIPGEDERNKEYEEIQKLVNSEPMEIPPDPMMMQQYIMAAEQAQMTGTPVPPSPEPQMVPTVEPDFDLDDHQLAAETDRRWLISDAGRLAKEENPAGYQNVLLHMKMHKEMAMQQQMEAQMQMMPPQQGPSPAAPPGASTGQEMGMNNESQPVTQ